MTLSRLGRHTICSLMLLSLLQISLADVTDLPGEITITIYLHGDGSADWTLETRLLLATASDVEAFDQYAANFSSSKDSYLSTFGDKMSRIVSRAEAITGRSMRAEDFDAVALRLSMLDKEYGVIRYSFRWVGFGIANGKEVRVGDVFEGGYYLSQNEVLIVVAPKGLRVQTLEPSPQREEDGKFTWIGPLNFAPGEPRLILREASMIPWTAVLLGVFAGVMVVVAGWWTITRRGRSDGGGPGTTDEGGSYEEMILDVLRQTGKMPQSEIVKSTGISKSKVSSVLSDLEKRGIVGRSKSGRQKMVYLQEWRDHPEKGKNSDSSPPNVPQTQRVIQYPEEAGGKKPLPDLRNGVVLARGSREITTAYALSKVKEVLRSGGKAVVVLPETTGETPHEKDFELSLLLEKAKHGSALDILRWRRGESGLAAAISRGLLRRPNLLIVDAGPSTPNQTSELCRLLSRSVEKAAEVGTKCLFLFQEGRPGRTTHQDLGSMLGNLGEVVDLGDGWSAPDRQAAQAAMAQ